jgi:hypothetical protein
MNWLSNRLTDGFKKRIFKFVLKKALGRFIQELDLSQLDIQISSGVYSLNNVLIKTEVRFVALFLTIVGDKSDSSTTTNYT